MLFELREEWHAVFLNWLRFVENVKHVTPIGVLKVDMVPC